MAERKAIKRACDGCKIRKIKCSERPPCNGCNAIGIQCTFNKMQRTRGPRNLRRKTMLEIAQTQGRYEAEDEPSTSVAPTARAETTSSTSLDSPVVDETPAKTPIASLVLRLCIYRLRLFPVWPIVAVEEVMASLQRDEDDTETYALANAVGAATIAQLKLSPAEGDNATGGSMEAECQRSKGLNKDGPQVNLNSLRIAFFLHVYHENLKPGGAKSLLYLREAITVAQMMNLHRESAYITLSLSEQQLRRRITWLLFITERGVAMLHKLPVVLKPNTLFPSMDGGDETHILPAFQKLVNLFWIFNQSGAFDILENSDDVMDLGEIGPSSRSRLGLLEKTLKEVPIDWDTSNDVQKADIWVTRQWMRAVLWRVSMNHGLSSTANVTSLSHPIQIAKEFLSVISQLPRTALEAHGPSMELKIYEIASAVTDAVANNARPAWNNTDRPRDVLDQLHQILSSYRGGNQSLISMLGNKIAGIQNGPQMLIEPSSRIEELDDQWLSESTTSPDSIYNATTTMEGLQDQQRLQNEAQQAFNNGGCTEGEQVEGSAFTPGYPSMQQQQQQQQQQLPQGQFPDLPWPMLMAGDNNGQPQSQSISSATDLYQQLQNFDGSFNDVESSGTLDRFLYTSDFWSNPLPRGLNMGSSNANGY